MPRFAVPFATGFAGCVRYGRAKAPTSSARISSRRAISSRFLIFCCLIDRFGTFNKNIKELNGMISDFSRRTRWIKIGIAKASEPNSKNRSRNDINQMLLERAAKYVKSRASSSLHVTINHYAIHEH